MAIRNFLAGAVLMAVLAGAALAADITGKWTGTSSMGDNAFTLTFAFKQEGEKLTGTVTGPQGDPLPISDGKVQGDKLSFTVKVDMGGNSMKITHDGVIKGEEITLGTKVEGGQDFGGGPMTLKRTK
jgi:opacity protein-like surface antigen